MHGQMGEISFTSFNNKIIKCNGGAIFTNNKTIMKEIMLLSYKIKNFQVNTRPEKMRSLLVDKYFSSLTKHQINSYPIIKSIFNIWYKLNKESFISNYNKLNYKNLIKQMNKIKQIKEQSIRNARCYWLSLKKNNIQHPKINTDLLWKYSVVLNNIDRQLFLKKIKKMGYRHLIGTSYTPPLSRYWYPKQQYPISNIISDRIINLPVDISITEENSFKLCEIINRVINK